MMNQQTLQHSVTRSGKGLHTGVQVHLTLLPAEENSGIRICRTDLPGRPTYEALAQYVGKTNRGTVLINGPWRVSTVEHLLAALYAMEITNCLIEVDGPEIPILNGSAQPWVEAITEAGMATQTAPAKEWVITQPIHLSNAHGSSMILTPADHYDLSVKVEYPSTILHCQQAELTLLSDFATQIAPARTFCFLREIAPLLAVGLIKGGDLDNAVVIYDKPIPQWVMNLICRHIHRPPFDASQLGYLVDLNFPNEPARHKLLDVIGDMSLLGVRIRGHIEVTRPGHGFNTFACQQIMKQYL